MRRLRLLVELSERGTIAAVADALHFTASTVSQALSALEAEVGVALLERGPRSVHLTPAGASLAARGREILVDLGAAREVARAQAGVDRPPLTVATFPSAGAGVVAAAMTSLRTLQESVEVRIVEAEPPEALERLRAGLVDLAVVYEHGDVEAERSARISYELLFDEPVLACLPPSGPAVANGVVDLASLRGRPFVAGRRGTACHRFTLAACRAAGFEADIAYETDDIGLTCALVNRDLATALMASSLVRGAANPPRTARVPALPGRRVLLARRSRDTEDSGVEVLRRALDRAARRPLIG